MNDLWNHDHNPYRTRGTRAGRIGRLAGTLISAGLLAWSGLTLAAPPEGKGNNKVSGGTTLTAPSGLTTSVASSSQINLRWTDPNSGENGFEIQRSLSASSGFSSIASVSKNTSSYASTGLNSGTYYCYRVRATGRKGTVSGYSNTACATTDAAGDTTAPTVSISSPASGTIYDSAQTVTISASAADNVAVTQVDFYRNGSRVKSDTLAPYSYSWSVSAATNGAYSWTARAYDAAGNDMTSSAVDLNVNIPAEDTTAPTVSITSPGSGSTYTSAQTVTVTASASDNVGVTKVEFRKGGVLMHTDTTNAYSYAWSVSEADNGSHSWTARAYDAAGNLKTSSAVSVTVDIGSSTGGSGTHEWSRDFGGPSFSDSAGAQAVTADTSGNAITTGNFQGSVNFGGSTLTSNTQSDLFLVKYSATGVHQWSRRYGGTMYGSDNVLPQAITALPNGDIVVTGYFNGTVNLGGNSLTSMGADDVFIASYSSSGTHRWSKRLGSSGYERALGVATDGNGNIYVTGYFQGTASFGGTSLASAGSYDIFLAKYSSNGAHQWSKRLGGTSTDLANDITVDTSGNPVITGNFKGTTNLGGSGLASAGSYDIFVAKYSTNGSHQWSSRYGGAGNDYGYGIDTGPGDEVYLTGSFIGSVNFGGGALSSNGGSDIVLAKYASSGTHLWSSAYGSTQDDVVNALSVDGYGDVAITGTVYEWINFGGDWLTSNGSRNMYAAKFSAAGDHLWSLDAGALYDDNGNDIAQDAVGNTFATGAFMEAIDFGGGNLTSPGGSDGYLVKFSY